MRIDVMIEPFEGMKAIFGFTLFSVILLEVVVTSKLRPLPSACVVCNLHFSVEMDCGGVLRLWKNFSL